MRSSRENIFFIDFPPKKGSQTWRAESEEIFLFIQSLFTLFPRPETQKKKEWNKSNFYLSYVIVCKIIWARRKFSFHLKLPSSVWLSVHLLLLLRLHLKTNFLKNIYSASIDTHAVHFFCYCCFIPSILIFVDFFSSSPFGSSFFTSSIKETWDDSRHGFR